MHAGRRAQVAARARALEADACAHASTHLRFIMAAAAAGRAAARAINQTET